MEYGGGRKRGRHEAAFNGNGGYKKSKQEMESFSTGIGSKSKPCTKFFSTSGCSFGEGCHFLHYVPGGLKNAFQMHSTGSSSALPPSSRSSGVPSRRVGLGRPTGPSYEDRHSMGPIPSRMDRQMDPQHQVMGAASSFGATATAKISIDASHAGAIIGKNGVNSKHICRLTGVKLSIRENEMDPNLRNIELEGSFDQIDRASAMVRELVGNVRQDNVHGHRQGHGHGHGQGQGQGHRHGQGPPMKHAVGYGPGASNFKTKVCENFTKGSCTFGDKCHFAHGNEELRK